MLSATMTGAASALFRLQWPKSSWRALIDSPRARGGFDAHPEPVEVEAALQIGAGAAQQGDGGAVDDVADRHPALAFVQRGLDDRRGEGAHRFDEEVDQRAVGLRAGDAAGDLLRLDVHADGEGRRQPEPGVAVVALAGAEDRGAVAQLHLGPGHETFEPDALAALVEVAAEADVADAGRLGLDLHALRGDDARVHADGLGGGDLLAGGEGRSEGEDLVGPGGAALGDLNAVGEDGDGGAGQLALDADAGAALGEGADDARGQESHGANLVVAGMRVGKARCSRCWGVNARSGRVGRKVG